MESTDHNFRQKHFFQGEWQYRFECMHILQKDYVKKQTTKF